jgi:hypothetical protein
MDILLCFDVRNSFFGVYPRVLDTPYIKGMRVRHNINDFVSPNTEGMKEEN